MMFGARAPWSCSTFVVAAIFAAGCAQSDPIDADGEDGPNGPQADEPAICLLHNCSEDAHCGACDGGRNTCLVEEGRCVACSADTGTGCEAGEECSSWGNCVPEGLTCPTDDHGTPTIGCQVNADCAACDPMHQICDTALGQCVACTTGDTSACQSTDLCIANECSAQCPSSCNMDSDCAQCDGAGFEAHACNAHRCAECSPTVPCPGGLSCSPQGVCQAACGSDGQGTCASDADCDGCGAGNGECHIPLNDDVGECGPSAAGCSQLGGNGSLVLPEPWSDFTNLCSDDGDCAGVGATLNVGKMLRDLTGFDEIGDANITYGMNSCAAVNIGSVSCGVCVPCQVDSDCAPIDIDQVAGDAFGPIGSLAAALLLDLVFGPNEHQINMYCEQVAGGYGVCAPCPGLIYECGVGGGGGGGGGGGSGSCDHDVCEVGSAMDGSCDSCAADVCDIDPYCCDTEWDETCVGEAEEYCGESCGGGGGGGGGGGAVCHDECTEGDPMDPTCNDCVDAICAQDSYCCDTEWDSVCVGYVDELCSPGC